MNSTQSPTARPPRVRQGEKKGSSATSVEAPKKEGIFMIGGGQKVVTDDDLKQITFSIKVNVECKNDEREVTAVVPIYEHALLSLIWSRIGGEARIVADWLPAQAKYPRIVKLSRDMLRDEVQRLEATYRTHLPNGTVKNHFKDLYGRDGDPVRGFYKVINQQVRAWHELSDRVRGGYRIIAEDLLSISNLARPEGTIEAPDLVTNFDDVTIEDGEKKEEQFKMEGEIDEDPLADLQQFLYQRNWESDVVMDLCKILGDGDTGNKVKVNELPSLHGKKGEQTRLMNDYKAFIAHAERKVQQQDALKAESEIVPIKTL
jgi:hypothetical protein